MFFSRANELAYEKNTKTMPIIQNPLVILSYFYYNCIIIAFPLLQGRKNDKLFGYIVNSTSPYIIMSHGKYNYVCLTHKTLTLPLFLSVDVCTHTNTSKMCTNVDIDTDTWKHLARNMEQWKCLKNVVLHQLKFELGFILSPVHWKPIISTSFSSVLHPGKQTNKQRKPSNNSNSRMHSQENH